MVWAVSLSTTDLITRSLTPEYKYMAFGVYLNSVTREGPLRSKQCSTSMTLYLEAGALKAISERTSYLQDSIGISPLLTLHPQHSFQRAWVRTSSKYYLTFILDMGRSPGFGSTTCYLCALFRLAFATAPLFPLNLGTNRNSPVLSTQRHAITH